ncbi:hypothetical protein E2I00_015737, partial [Balaenoptera physalus]
LLKIHPEAQRAIEAAPQEPEQKRSKLDTDLSTALSTSCPVLGQAVGREQQLPDAQPRFGPKFPGNSLCVPGPVAFGSMSLESAIPTPALAAGTPRRKRRRKVGRTACPQSLGGWGGVHHGPHRVQGGPVARFLTTEGAIWLGQ